MSPAFISARSIPEHHLIELALDAFAKLAPKLDLPDGSISVNARPIHNGVTFLAKLPPPPIAGFLSDLALMGAADLANIRHQVEGYPYDHIAREYERATLEARRTRRVLPEIELDSSPLLPLTVANVIGGPATTIRTSSKKDLIRVRGVPFNHEFAHLANDAILKIMRDAIRARLPIIGNLRSAHS